MTEPPLFCAASLVYILFVFLAEELLGRWATGRRRANEDVGVFVMVPLRSWFRARRFGVNWWGQTAVCVATAVLAARLLSPHAGVPPWGRGHNHDERLTTSVPVVRCRDPPSVVPRPTSAEEVAEPVHVAAMVTHNQRGPPPVALWPARGSTTAPPIARFLAKLDDAPSQRPMSLGNYPQTQLAQSDTEKSSRGHETSDRPGPRMPRMDRPPWRDDRHKDRRRRGRARVSRRSLAGTSA